MVSAQRIQQSLRQALQGDAKQRANLQELHRRHPRNPGILVAIAVLNLHDQQPQDAIPLLKQARKLGFPDKMYLLLQLLQAATMCADQELFERSWAELRKLGVSQERLIDSIRRLVPLADQAMSDRLFDEWRQLAGPHDYRWQINRGDWLYRRGMKEEAREQFQNLPNLEHLDNEQRIMALVFGERIGWKNTRKHLQQILEEIEGERSRPTPREIRMLVELCNKCNLYEKRVELLTRQQELEPDQADDIRFKKIDTWQRMCAWREVAQQLPDYLNSVHSGAYRPPTLWRHLSLPGMTDELQCQLAQAFAAGFNWPLAVHQFEPKPMMGRPMRVGFLSADFKHHPVTQLLMEVLEYFDHREFTLIAYDNTQAPDSWWRERILNSFDEVVSVRSLSNEELFARMRTDQLDVIIELQGSTQDSRCWVLRHRVAPVQISWLGFLGTLGANFTDYIIADRHSIPAESRRHFHEKVIWLPDFCFPADTKRPAPEPPPRLLEKLPEDALVYCSFNAHYKINPDTFAFWMKLLDQVENSVLWLVDYQAESTVRLQQAAQDHGISPERLVFAQRKPHTEHLARLQLADIALDTWPHNSGATAIDTLWCGVPLVTFSGDTMMSRVAAGMVRTLGLPELCRDNPDDYFEYALELGRNPRLRADITRRLLEARQTSPLYNPERFTRHLNQALRMAYQRHECGLEPAHIELSAELDTVTASGILGEDSGTPIAVLIERGEYYLFQEAYSQAAEYFEQAAHRTPDHPHVLYGQGMLAGLDGDYQRSLALLEKASELEPENSKFREHLDIMRRKAAENWQQTMAQLLSQAQKHHQHGAFEAAAQCYQALLDKSPRHPNALHYYGLLQVQQGTEVQEGLEKMRLALELQPQNQAFLVNYNKAHRMHSNREKS